MTADELEAALKRLDWQKADLSHRLDVNPNTVSKWLATDAVPTYAAEYVLALLAMHEIVESPRAAFKRMNKQ